MEWLWIVIAAVIVAGWLLFAGIVTIRAALSRGSSKPGSKLFEGTEPPSLTDTSDTSSKNH